MVLHSGIAVLGVFKSTAASVKEPQVSSINWLAFHDPALKYFINPNVIPRMFSKVSQLLTKKLKFQACMGYGCMKAFQHSGNLQ